MFQISFGKLFFYYSKIKLIYLVFFIFFAFSSVCILSFRKKIINFYQINNNIHLIKNEIFQIKQQRLTNLKMTKKTNMKNYEWLNNGTNAMNQLIESVHQFDLIQYQVNAYSARDENNVYIQMLELSLSGDYFQLIHWLLYKIPYFCFLKQISFKKIQAGVVNLSIKMEIYET